MSTQMALPFPPEAEWRDIPGYEGWYRVSNTGLIQRLNSSGEVIRVLNPGTDKKGYTATTLSIEGKRKSVRIHRLVILAFIGICPEGQEVNHINGVKHDNRVENLEYVTDRENTMHARNVLGRRAGYEKDRNRYQCRGEKHGMAILTNDTVREIRRLRDIGLSLAVIGLVFGIDASHAGQIARRQIWKHVE